MASRDRGSARYARPGPSPLHAAAYLREHMQPSYHARRSNNRGVSIRVADSVGRRRPAQRGELDPIAVRVDHEQVLLAIVADAPRLDLEASLGERLNRRVEVLYFERHMPRWWPAVRPRLRRMNHCAIGDLEPGDARAVDHGWDDLESK